MTDRPVVPVVNAVRGALIGAAEVVPGVSGGTVALVVGVYERLIDSASQVLGAVRLVASGDTAAARAQVRRVDWLLVLPLLAGMLVALVTLARVIEPALEEHPERSRALFLGLVLASVVVPASMVGRWGRREYVLAAVAAVAAVLLTSIPPASGSDPAVPFVFGAAALAVCALVLPGVSGSFLLLSIGVYEPTISAVNDRDLGYLAVFAAGALTGLVLFVKVLEHLLTHRRRATLAVMTGLMVGSLRALWPWQEDDRSLLAPQGDLPVVAVFAVVGLAVVGGLLLAEARARSVGVTTAARIVGEDPLDDAPPPQASRSEARPPEAPRD